MKIKNIKLWDWVVRNERFKWKIIEYFVSSKKIVFFFCMYKMYLISTEGYEDPNVHYLPQKMVKFVYVWNMLKLVRVLKTCLI